MRVHLACHGGNRAQRRLKGKLLYQVQYYYFDGSFDSTVSLLNDVFFLLLRRCRRWLQAKTLSVILGEVILVVISRNDPERFVSVLCSVRGQSLQDEGIQ